MTSIAFTKGHGTKNDFVLLFDEGGQVGLGPDLVRYLCDRRGGIGVDGVIRAVRAGNVADARGFDPNTWFMDYWNADGTPAEMCGNGIRVYAHYLISEGLVAPERRDTLPIGTRAGVKDVLAGVAGYTVDLGRWRLAEERLVSAYGLDVARPGLGLDLGNPHVVTALAHAGELEGLDLHRAPSLDPAPAGLTVQPVRIDYGAATAELAWVGDEPGIDHARRVLARPGRFTATLHFLEPFAPSGDRKTIAAEARARIDAARQ